MVKESLTEYINRLLKSGYDKNTIRTTLINAGYNPSQIDRALKYAGTVPGKKSIALTGKIIVIVISSLILILLLVIGGIKILTPEPKTIALAMLPTKTEIYAGDKIAFLNEFSSEQNRKVNVLLNLQVIDARTDNMITSKQEKTEVGARRSTTSEITIPADAPPSRYFVRATLSYEGKSQQESFSFEVLEKPLAEPAKPAEAAPEITEAAIGECPETCDDYNKCTNDFCEKGICRHTPLTPCCGNGICEEGENKLNCIDDCRLRENTPAEISDQAVRVSMTDPESAAVLCSSISRTTEADECFAQIALSAEKSLLCENVQDPETKDRCYMSFALEGDFSVCTKINDNYMSKGCNSLRRAQDIKERTQKTIEEQGFNTDQIA